MSVFETYKTKTDAVISSAASINASVMKTLAAMIKINLDTAAFLSDASIRQMTALARIKNMEALRTFTVDSITQGGEVGKRMVNDCKSWMHLGQEISGAVTDRLVPAKTATPAHKKPANAA